MKQDKEAITKIMSAIAQAKLALSEAERDFQNMVKSMPTYKPSNFCPVCGKPLTDEAVQMVMERMEALHETT